MLQPKAIEMARLYYDEGWTMERIAKHFQVNKSSVCRSIKRVDKRQCPVGTSCKNCKMPECIIKPEYQHMVNSGEQNKKQPKEFDMEFCIVCGKLCRTNNYATIVDQNGNQQKVYFHKLCYNKNTIGNRTEGTLSNTSIPHTIGK